MAFLVPPLAGSYLDCDPGKGAAANPAVLIGRRVLRGDALYLFGTDENPTCSIFGADDWFALAASVACCLLSRYQSNYGACVAHLDSRHETGGTHGPRTAHTSIPLLLATVRGRLAQKKVSRFDDKHMPGGEKRTLAPQQHRRTCALSICSATARISPSAHARLRFALSTASVACMSKVPDATPHDLATGCWRRSHVRCLLNLPA